MRNKIKSTVLILLCIVLFVYNVSYADPQQKTVTGAAVDIDMQSDVMTAGVGASSLIPAPDISAPSAILVEAESGQVLYSKNPTRLSHISAACKLMTILVALENADINSNVTVSSESAGAEGSALNLEVGAKYPLEELLYAIMLTSANDAAIAVAEHVAAGSIEKFVSKMNETAKKLNMNNTHFENPTGLYSESQYTTAADIASLVKYAINNAEFNKMFCTTVRPWYYSPGEDKIMTSSNKLFWGYAGGIEGGKTGYNKKEQQSIITTSSRNQLRLICVVLDTEENLMYQDATALLDYGFENFRKSVLVKKGEIIKTANYNGNEINLISQSNVMYVHPIGESYIKEFRATSDLKAPLNKSIPAGKATYILQDGTEINVSLYPENITVPPDDIKTKVRKTISDNRDIFILLFVLIVIEGLLILFNLGKLMRKFVLYLARRFMRQRR